jgi:ligand-binding SRPBCC domain-containing protein
MPFVVERSSVLHADPHEVWAAVSTIEGVNRELAPWVRMTVPGAATGMRLEDAPLGRPVFTSWLLLLREIPFDRHRLVLVEVEPGRRFLERSSSWLHRVWQHERIVEPRPEGCRVTDRIMFEPWLPLVGKLARPVVDALFRSRHRALRQRYGPQ